MYEANVSLGRKTDTVQSLVQALVNAAPETPLIWLIQQPAASRVVAEPKRRGGTKVK